MKALWIKLDCENNLTRPGAGSNIKSFFDAIHALTDHTTFVILLTACVAPNLRVGYCLDQVEDAIDVGLWEAGYRFLVSGLISPDEKTKARAIEPYKSEPEVRERAANRFKFETLRKYTASGSFNFFVPLEKHRLRMYAVVATGDELRVASDNYQNLLDDYVTQQANAKAKAEADAAAFAKLISDFQQSQTRAVFPCKDRLECEKAFALTQIFIATNTDMKIQMANGTIIQTHNPQESFAMGATAYKNPTSGTAAEIRLSLTLNGQSTWHPKNQ